MTSDADIAHLQPCLEKIIVEVDNIIKLLKTKHFPQLPQPSDQLATTTSATSHSNLHLNSLPLDADDNNLLENFTTEVTSKLASCLSKMSKAACEYIEDLLDAHSYDSDAREFIDGTLDPDQLESLKYDLSALLDSSKAYPAAEKGDLKAVKEFLKKYPSFIDKSGPQNRTLLYAAASENQLPIVKYLIETLQCPVNVQNRRDVVNRPPRPEAEATALHAATSNGHFDMVKYLVEKGADSSIQNQRTETPIKSPENHMNTKKVRKVNKLVF
jgi:hypothetical protein